MDRYVKEFLDTLKGTANVVGETVAEVTRESAKKLGVKKDVAKLNMEVLRIRAAIEGIHNEIGKEAYALHICEDDAEAEQHQQKVDELLEEIDAKQDQIVQLNRQIDLLGGGVACEQCGRVSPADYEFCPTCGAKLEKPCCDGAECCCNETEDACCCGEAEDTCCCGEDEEKKAEDASCGCDACRPADSGSEEAGQP